MANRKRSSVIAQVAVRQNPSKRVRRVRRRAGGRSNSNRVMVQAVERVVPRGGGSLNPTGGTNRANDVIVQYANTLNDPFTHGPMRLGWGTLLPTLTATAYYRATINANADGSFAIFLGSYLAGATGGPIWYNNGGAATTGYTAASWNNLTPLNAAINGGRVVSLGLRAMPQVAATSAPGQCYAGCLPAATTYGTATTVSPSSYSAQPYFRWGRADHGATALGRPFDTTSFAMYTSFDNLPQTNQMYFGCPIIVFLGLPASCPITIEAVMNFEGTMELTSSTTFLEETGQGTNANTITLSSEFASIEQSFNAVRKLLTPSGVIGDAPLKSYSPVGNHVMATRPHSFTSSIVNALRSGVSAASALTDAVFVDRGGSEISSRQAYMYPAK
jgi:hypothetical protein